MGKSITLIDGDSVGDTITGVHDNTSGSSRGIEREHCLDGNVHGRGVEGFEHDLGHLFSVGLWVHWSFSEKDWVFFWSNSELIVEGVMPDLLEIKQIFKKRLKEYLFHIIPVSNDTVLNRIFQSKDSSL